MTLSDTCIAAALTSNGSSPDEVGVRVRMWEVVFVENEVEVGEVWKDVEVCEGEDGA